MSRSRMRRAVRWAAFAVAGLTALAVLAVVALHTPAARRYAQGKVTELLAAQNITFSSEGFRYNLLDLSADLRNVRVVSARLPDAPPFLEIDRARVDLSSTQALRGRYVVQSGTVEGVRLHYFVNENGVDNLPRPPASPDDPGQPLDYLIADLEVPDAVVRYENRAQNIDITLPRASLSMQGDALTDRHDVTIDATGGDLRARDRVIHIDRLSAALDLGRDDVKIERAELQADGAVVNVNGTVGPFDQPSFDLGLQATADLARASTLAGLGEPLPGQFVLEASLQGTLDALALRIARVNASGAIGTITGDGVVMLRGPGTSRLDATLSRVDAEPLMKAFGLPYRVATRADGQLSAEWPALEFTAASGDASLALTPSRASAAEATLPLGGRVEVSGSGERLEATLSEVRSAGATLNGRVTIADRERLDGTIRANAPDVQTTVNAVEAFLGRRRGSLVPVAVGGQVTVNGRIHGRTTAPAMDAVVAAPSLTVGDAADIYVNGRLGYRPDRLTIERLDLAWLDGDAQASGVVGLRGARTLDLTVRADALTVQGLLQAFERGDVPASGRLSAYANVRGTVDRPLASFHVDASDLVAYHEVWGALSADARLANQLLDVTAFQLDKPQPTGDGRIWGKGSYALGDRRFAVELQSANVELISMVLPGGRPVMGGLDLSGRASGTLTDPTGQLNIRATDLQIGEYIVGTVTADTTLADGMATTVARSERYQLSAEAEIGLSRPYPATLDADINGLDLAALPLRIETPLTGSMTAQVAAAGPLAAPREGHARATIADFTGSWNHQPFRIDGPAELRYENERVGVDRLRVVARDSTIEISGNVPTERGTDRSVEPGTITLDARANLATLAQYAPAGSAIAADGRLTVTGTLTGTLQAIAPDLKIALVDALVLSPAIEPGISNLNATATIADGAGTVDRLTANWGSAQISASARVPLDLLPELPVEIPRDGGPAAVKVRLDGLDPRAIPGAPRGVSGRLSLDADVSARRPDIRQAEGRVLFNELRLGFDNLTLEQKAPSTLEMRDGVLAVQQFALEGSVGTLAAAGTVGLTGVRPVDLDVDGNLNIAAISAITDRVRAEGESTIDLSASGTVADPVFTGNVALRDGTVVIDDPNIAAEAVNVRLEVDGNRINIGELRADVNGGTLTGAGGLTLDAAGLTDVNVELSTRDFAYDAPLDLRSLSDADVRITSAGETVVVGGQITIEEAGLTGDVNFDTGLLATIQARPPLELTPERNPFLENVSFNVNVDTATPVLVDNNLAKAEVTVDVRVVGTPYATGLLGRMEVLDGGMVTLNERVFRIDRGQITFIDDRRIVPSFDLQMNTTAGNYDITLGVTGEPGTTDTTLTSNPTLPEPDIMAMLVTGRTLDEMRGEEYDVAREQVMSYLTGRVGSTLGRGLQRATGLSEVRIDPNVIANETEPGARLTLGQDITDELTLMYSVDLADSDDQIWLATYDVTRRFQTRALRDADNSYRFDFRHDIRKGGRPEPRREPRVRPDVAVVSVSGDAPIAAEELGNMLGAKEGDEFDYFAVRNGIEDIEERLRESGWAQSRVRLDRSEDAAGVTLALRVTRGPQVEFVYAGATPPQRVQDEVRRQWQRGVFDAQRTDDAEEALIGWLMSDDYLQATVGHRIEEVNAERRRVHFDITPGARSSTVLLAFEGSSGIPADELDQVIEEQKLERQLFTDPTLVTELLERVYREQGYLSAEIDEPRYEFEGPVARVVIAVTEGPQFTVNDVTFRGLSAVTEPVLTANLPVAVGDPFRPVAAENSLQHIRNVYWDRGYNDVRATYQLAIDRTAGTAAVAFSVQEGRQAVVADVRIAGNDETSTRLIREQLEITPGQPLSLNELSRSRKNLYDSGAFSMVDLSRDSVSVVADEAGGSADGVIGAITGQQPAAQPVVVDVDVREVQPYQFRYGASYDTEGRFGGVVDASVHNVLGKARVIGVGGRYDARIHEGRLYLTQPTLRHWPIQTTAAIYYREEDNPATQISDAFNVDRRGASIQQERTIGNSYVWTYGYRFERARTYSPDRLGAEPEVFTKVSPLTTAFVRETRDEVLDATRGAFSAHAFSYSPKWLGSDDTYIKYLGQYFHYFPLQPERRRRFSNEIIRPRLVFATGVRVGLSKGMGTFVPTSERFYAGGSTTIRGFEQNALGTIGPTGRPVGGDALFILNNELRFPLMWIVDGVTFLDVGNVFERTSDFSFTDLRETAGVGLRLRTKWVLVRTDYGFVLDRRPGEPRGRFYFSIGQAF